MIRTTLYDLPTRVHAFVVMTDDDYTIVVNAKLNREMQVLAYQHELYHIKNGDITKRTPTDIIEIVTHERIS